MRTIFETFKKSIYDPVFYQNAVVTPLSDIVRYYIKFSLLLSVAMTIYLGIALAPQGITFVKEYAPELVKSYFPSELTIHIEKGVASVNVTEPYIIEYKNESWPVLKEQGIERMLVIDTKNDFNKKKFDEYKTFALLTRTEIVTRGNDGQITIQELGSIPDASINQEWLLSWVEKTRDSLGAIVFVGIIGTFIAMLFGYLKYFIVLLLFALIPKLIAYLKKMPLSYSGAYKMSLYAIVPALALKTIINILGVFFIPAYFTLLVFMLIVAINMKERDEPTLFESK
ncbi:MAG: DUF1189 family protein [Minisyncoccia bacterium]